MRHRQHRDRISGNVVDDGIWIAPQYPLTVAVAIRGFGQRGFRYAIDHREQFDPEGLGCEDVAFAIPDNRFADVLLGPRGEQDRV